MKLLIGCSSSNDIPQKYLEGSRAYLEGLMRENDLVFGACNTGIMGLSYEIAKLHGRSVVGISPEIFKDDLLKLDCDKEILTKTISDRTDALIEESDALVFLPGGIGTVYELMTSIESKRSGEFDKPIIIYNSCGYFDKLFEFLDRLYDEKFTSEKVRKCYHFSNDSDDTLLYIKNYQKYN